MKLLAAFAAFFICANICLAIMQGRISGERGIALSCLSALLAYAVLCVVEGKRKP